VDENLPTESNSDDPDELVGSIVGGRFRVGQLSTVGGSTWIYVATDTETGRPVTLKVIRPGVDVSPDFATRFSETMRSVAALSHPNVVTPQRRRRLRLGHGRRGRPDDRVRGHRGALGGEPA
jgi:hypothetical protein